jgi:hypothetical protein
VKEVTKNTKHQYFKRQALSELYTRATNQEFRGMTLQEIEKLENYLKLRELDK